MCITLKSLVHAFLTSIFTSLLVCLSASRSLNNVLANALQQKQTTFLLTDGHLEDILRLSCSSIEPDV